MTHSSELIEIAVTWLLWWLGVLAAAGAIRLLWPKRKE